MLLSYEIEIGSTFCEMAITKPSTQMPNFNSYFICKAVCKIAPATPCTLNTSIMLNKYTMWFVFLAAQSSSRSLVVGPSVRPLVRRSV